MVKRFQKKIIKHPIGRPINLLGLQESSQEMSGMEVTPFFSPFILQALNNDIVIEEIISHLEPNLHDLKKYRLVCHKWNDLIVRKINKSRPSLQIPLRYGPEIPPLIVKSNARRLAQEILENVSITLTGTASRLLFDTVVIDRDFYLAGVVLKWKHFLEAHGEYIRHLKFKIRSHELQKLSDNHVKDCEEIISMKDLVSTFSATPNLESLYFSIRFSSYLSGQATQPKPMVLADLPILHKLSRITIREPKGISYSDTLLRQILGMAPNLTSLYVKPSSFLSTLEAAINSINKDVIQSLTSLNISNAHFPEFDERSNMMNFRYLNLTTLELNNISGIGRHDWMDELLLAQYSSLVKLILGDRKNTHPILKVQDLIDDMDGLCFVQFPPVMEHLKLLEVNLSKFRLCHESSYAIQFPVLESFTLTGATEIGDGNKWTLDHIGDLLPIVSGRSQTLKQFSLIGPIEELSQRRIIMCVQMTFPMAECHFHSESDNQFCQQVRQDLSIYYRRLSTYVNEGIEDDE